MMWILSTVNAKNLVQNVMWSKLL